MLAFSLNRNDKYVSMKCTFYYSVSEQSLFTFSKMQHFYSRKKRKQKNLVCILYNHTVIISFISFPNYVVKQLLYTEAPMALSIMILNTVLPYLPPHPKSMHNFKEH